MMVVSGSASRNLGKGIAASLGCKAVESVLKEFPDGEFKVTGNGEGDAVIVQSCPPPQAKTFLELLFLLDACWKADKRIAMVPYLPFSRQDKEFLEGESVSARAIAKAVESFDADALVTVDAHSQAALDFFSIKAVNVSAMPSFGRHLKGRVEDPVIIAPDKKALMFAKMIRKATGGKAVFFEKERDRRTGEVTFRFPDVEMEGRPAIICDDIVTGGSTMFPAVKFCRDRKAKAVYIAVTHGMFLNGVIERLKKEGVNEILASDSVERNYVTTVSVAEAVATSINKLD